MAYRRRLTEDDYEKMLRKMEKRISIDWDRVNSNLIEMSQTVKGVSEQLNNLAETLSDRIDTSSWVEIAEQIEIASYKIMLEKN
tara:strand:- start:194 stop:445 length:252 start_codon:yes stop_codon:yes gene_type:complete